MGKKVLIASYVFPPFPGIGGRRWAKFAKELSRKGYEVHVICSENPFPHKSQWITDINLPGITVHPLPPLFPRFLMIRPLTARDKIGYKVSLMRMKLMTRGNYYDRAVNWKAPFMNKATQLIRDHGIKNLIATGAPFHLVHHAAMVKKADPSVNFIADFRDPWTNNNRFMGFDLLTGERKEMERKMEKESVQYADTVTTVADEMKDYFEHLGSKEAKFITLSNGYDPDDFEIQHSIPRQKKPHLTFVFTGTLYDHLGESYSTFLSALDWLKSDAPDAYRAMQFEFYGDIPSGYRQMAALKKHDNLYFNPPVTLKETGRKIAEAGVCMLFLQDHLNFSFSTKFFEYLHFRKKIAVFSRPGPTQEFIRLNRLGYAVGGDNPGKALLEIYDDFISGRLGYEGTVDITRYSVSALTEKLTGFLI